MRLILHGQLRDLYGEYAEIETDRVADALEGWSRQMPNFPRKLLVDVVGFDTEEKLRAVTDVKEVHLIPAMFGGGGKFGSIILGAVVVVAGVLLLSTPFGIPLIVSGATMVLSGVVGLFMKAPTLSKANDPAASKYLGLNRNTTAIGTPITMAWGRTLQAGHFLSLQSQSDSLVHGVFPE